MIVVGWVMFHESRSPTYRGRTVREWALRTDARDRAAEEMVKTLGDQAVPELVRLLNYDDPLWQRAARKYAPRLPARWRNSLLEKAGLPQRVGVRCAAATALGVIGAPATNAIPALGRALRTDHHQVRWNASAALWRIGRESLPVLTEALQDSDVTTLRASAFALAELGPDAAPAIPALINALKHPSQDVRDAVNISLARIGAPSVSTLTNLLAHGDLRAREAAVQTIMKFQLSVRLTVPALAKLAVEADSPISRQQAVEALGNIRLPTNPAIKALTTALQDREKNVRLAAANALALMPARAQPAISNLTACLSDESPEVRQAAANALSVIGPATNASPVSER